MPISEYTYIEYALLIFLASGLGISIRQTLKYSNQLWVTTAHQTLSYCFLPSIVMMITVFISGNIALSLGMIGALSIVRFRNPVKSPFELVMFFALITIGIGVTVNFKLSIILTVIINLLIFIFFKIDSIMKKKNKSLFNLSFEEGLKLNSLEVESRAEIIELENSKDLVQFFSSSESKTYNYKLQSENKENIDHIKEKIKNNPNIINIYMNYAL